MGISSATKPKNYGALMASTEVRNPVSALITTRTTLAWIFLWTSLLVGLFGVRSFIARNNSEDLLRTHEDSLRVGKHRALSLGLPLRCDRGYETVRLRDPAGKLISELICKQSSILPSWTLVTIDPTSKIQLELGLRWWPSFYEFLAAGLLSALLTALSQGWAASTHTKSWAAIHELIGSITDLQQNNHLLATLAHNLRASLWTHHLLVQKLAGTPSELYSSSKRNLERFQSALLERPQKNARIVTDGIEFSLGSVIEPSLRLMASRPGLETFEVIRSSKSLRQIILRGNYYELASVFENILRNAFESVDAHSIQTQSPVEMQIRVNSKHAIVHILDSGIGLPPEFSLHCPRSTKPDGHGLGLAHAVATLQRAGGSFTICNRNDHPGAIATIIYPLAQGCLFTPPPFSLISSGGLTMNHHQDDEIPYRIHSNSMEEIIHELLLQRTEIDQGRVILIQTNLAHQAEMQAIAHEFGVFLEPTP